MVGLRDQPALGKLVGTQWMVFESKCCLSEEGEANRQDWCWQHIICGVVPLEVSPGRISGRKWEWDPWDGFSCPCRGVVGSSMPREQLQQCFLLLFHLQQQRAGKVFRAPGCCCGLRFACLLGGFHSQRGCSGLPFSQDAQRILSVCRGWR